MARLRYARAQETGNEEMMNAMLDNPGRGRKHRKHTPIVSEKQRGAMGAAYAAKKGERTVASLGPTARAMYESMSAAELKRHLEEAGGKKLPKRARRR